MLSFFLIGLSLVLTCIVGLQFCYLFYLDRVHRERKKHLQQLEQRSDQLTEQLDAAQRLIVEQRGLIDTVYPENEIKDDVWAEVIDDR